LPTDRWFLGWLIYIRVSTPCIETKKELKEKSFQNTTKILGRSWSIMSFSTSNGITASKEWC
jgi:hypothetical protein